MIDTNHPEFERNMRYLVKVVEDKRGDIPYWLRMEKYEGLKGLDSEWFTCMNCGEQIDRNDTEIKKTKYSKYLDTVTKTPCCSRLINKDLCPMICVGCNRIALFMSPHRNNDGFEYHKGSCYHIDRCSNCDGMSDSSTILEQIVYNKLNGINE